ncbi:MAG: DNA translocase FtsK 4TM domain-containing protein [Chitinophagales bacterium]|nr:DNA translocase FtsK 4TM domain-containing protein [Chitinophagales bacterium]
MMSNNTEITENGVINKDRMLTTVGFVSLFTAILLFIAFISYFFTWKADQDKVLDFSWKLLFSRDVIVANKVGRLGALLSHLFFYDWFGIASFLVVSFLSAVGINLVLKEKIFKIPRLVVNTIIWLILGATIFTFLFPDTEFPFGGNVGNLFYEWLSTLLGRLGAGLLLLALTVALLGLKFKRMYSIASSKIAALQLKRRQIINTANQNKHIDENLEKEEGFSLESILPDDIVEPIPHQKDKTFEKLKEEDKLEIDNIEIVAEDEKDANKDEEDSNLLELELSDDDEKSSKKKEKTTTKDDLDLEIETIQAFGVIDKNQLEEVKDEEEVDEDSISSEDDSDDDAEEFDDDTLYDPKLDLGNYQLPDTSLLVEHGDGNIEINKDELEKNKNQIVETLSNYNIGISKIKATVGPTVTLYEIVPDKGVRISKIKNLEDDIALSLSALGIRIIAPIPGRGTIGIEVPNEKKSTVSMRSMLDGEKFKNTDAALPVAIGKTISNEDYIFDLAKMPHLLMAGATGQGKSVGLNAILVSLLYKKHPAELKFVLVDPKKVELTLFTLIENHYLARLPNEEESIITDTKKVIHTLNALCIEMDERYELLKAAKVRHIKEYNKKFLSRKLNPNNGHRFLPYIVLIVDEFADLMMTAGKEVEQPIARLAQLARAIGIHLVVATQRPSVNIITGTIKANFPGRIAFKVTAKVDSRTILDASGADQLIGRGDMLLSQGGDIIRLQCAFVDTPEVELITNFIGKQRGYPEPYELPEYIDPKEEGNSAGIDMSKKDVLFEDAARVIVSNQIGSTSLIQRKLALGYARAGRLMDQLEAVGIVGPNLGSKARDVYVKTDEELERILQEYS